MCMFLGYGRSYSRIPPSHLLFFSLYFTRYGVGIFQPLKNKLYREILLILPKPFQEIFISGLHKYIIFQIDKIDKSAKSIDNLLLQILSI